MPEPEAYAKSPLLAQRPANMSRQKILEAFKLFLFFMAELPLK